MYARRRWARALWGILDQAMRPSGTGQAERGETERVWVWVRDCVYKCVCTSCVFLLSILWRNQMGSIHTAQSSGGSLQPFLVIFCHQSSAIFSLLLLSPSTTPHSFFLRLSVLLLCLHLGPPVCTVYFCSFTSVETFVECLMSEVFILSCELIIVGGTDFSCV